MELQKAKESVSLLDYAKENSSSQLVKAGGEYRLNPCPVCNRNDHFTIYPESNSYSSFSGCCKGGSIIDYLQEVEGLDQAQAIDKVKRLAGVEKENAKGFIPEALPQKEQEKAAAVMGIDKEVIAGLVEMGLQNTTDYYSSRGLTDKTINKYKLGYFPGGYDKPGYGKTFKYVLPVGDSAIVLRSNNEEDRYRNLGSPDLFNKQYLEDPSLTDKEIFITEGFFDALSLEELNRPAIALNSTAGKTKLLAALEANQAKLKEKLLIVALDTDEAGEKTTKEILQKAQDLWLSCVSFPLNGYKDINEALINDREGLQKQLEAIPLQGTVYDYLQEQFELDQAQRVREKDIDTGFKGLNHSLGGGLYPGLYVIGAITSLGKTAFALQLADNIAAGQQQVLFFSLEMARYEMVCRSLTRELYELQGNEDIATGHILRSRYQDKDIFSRPDFREALAEYKKGPAKYLSLVEGDFNITIDSIRAQAMAHETRTGGRPVIFIDYLQAIQPKPDSRITDKQHIDQTVIALKRLSRDLDLPVIVISSFNRASYGKDSADTNRVIRFMTAFKESGAIEYTADVLIAMDIKQKGGESIEEAKAKDRRLIDLVILKNRRGRAYEEIALTYLPKQNFFREGTF